MGTRQSSIARAESGKIEPSISFLEKVAKAVGTELIYPKFKFMLEYKKFDKNIRGVL
jgi:transcriptional regulator with XRE-family HTH domain